MQVTLQLHNDGEWQDAYKLQIELPEQGASSPVKFEVLHGYAVNYFGERNSRSFSSNYEVNPMDIASFKRWPAVLDDVLPTGYARQKWLEILGLQQASPAEQAISLLTQAAISPIGNIRVKESVERAQAETHPELETMKFSQRDVVERDHDFLDYARARGALSGGATGAGGAAPKLLLRRTDNQQVWIDTLQCDIQTDAHYLVKFPRGKESIHADILRAEAAYYRILDEWLKINTIDTTQMLLIEGARQPSLWLPRFDRVHNKSSIHRYGLESVYSLLNKEAGTFLRHEDVLAKLCGVINSQDSESIVIDYLKRDLLNLILGNTDNHGRNIAVLKTATSTTLAPVFDFAPMKADPEQIIRTTTWSNQFERAGQVDWLQLCDALQSYGDPERFKHELTELAEKLTKLTDALEHYQVPKSIIDFPALALSYTNEKLKRWGLL
ncbi:MAG: hypothetical protein COA51_05180 [Idiomarina sp.]|nr:MAG: hypothetical protein COA51_05180 [Idiomarina sp.]